jgi:hypothetical protein
MADTAFTPERHGFLGLVGYYRKFIHDFGSITAPLTRILHKDVFGWTKKAVEAFDALNRTLSSTPILQMSNFTSRFLVNCDASGAGFDTIIH